MRRVRDPGARIHVPNQSCGCFGAISDYYYIIIILVHTQHTSQEDVCDHAMPNAPGYERPKHPTASTIVQTSHLLKRALPQKGSTLQLVKLLLGIILPPSLSPEMSRTTDDRAKRPTLSTPREMTITMRGTRKRRPTRATACMLCL